METKRNLRLQFGTDIFSRLRTWGSIGTHHAFGLDRNWFALWMPETIGPSGLIIHDQRALEDKFDWILERLIQCNSIKVEKP